jgi:competence protein ComEA
MATQFPQRNGGLIRQHLAQQETAPYQAITLPTVPEPIELSPIAPLASLSEVAEEPLNETLPIPAKKLPITRIIVLALVGVLGLSIYLIWHPTGPAATGITQQQFVPTAPALKVQATTGPAPTTAPNGKIQVYIVGAIKHPGVYTLATNARLYQLLQAAGGPLPNANLVAVNLAAPLADGQEIYVLRIGETPPAQTGASAGTTGSTAATAGTSSAKTSGATSGTTAGTSTIALPVNVNTASADDMRQALHISSVTAQKIIGYRLQHGPFTSVEELSLVVSKTIYKKIEGEVTVS